MAPLLAFLAQEGLSLLAGAIKAKGKQVVEEKLGVKIPDDTSKISGELLQQLQIKQMEHEQFLLDAQIRREAQEIEAEKAGQKEVSDRWRFDMTSDSWLSKNVRPIVLLYLTVVVSLMAFAGKWLQMPDRWISVMENAWLVVLAAYFVGRTVQHWRKAGKNG